MVLSLLWAGASLPESERSLLFFLVPFLASSRALRAASLATLLRRLLFIISVAIDLFSSKNVLICSVTIFSTATLAWGVPNFPLVWPSNWRIPSGIFKLITAVKPSRTSLPSKVLSLPLTKPLFLA